MIKAVITSLLITVSSIGFTGCVLQEKAAEITNEGEALINDVSDSYNNVVDKVVETKNDIDTAVQKVEDAKDAINEITE